MMNGFEGELDNDNNTGSAALESGTGSELS